MKLSARTRRLIREALAEDIGSGDATSKAIFPASRRSRATIVARQPGVVCGAAIAAEVFRTMDRRLSVSILRRDGAAVRRGAPVLLVRGPVRSILTAERVALNFLQRLSGVATLAARYVAAVRGTRCKILDTRKTTPGWRELEKCAVRCGGAANHRMRLDELALIKDNHLAGARISEAVNCVRKIYPRLEIEVECDRLSQVAQAIRAGAKRILLDNMKPAQLRKAVKIARGKAKLEASGGITLKNARRIARTGVSFISVGALTHSAPALDFSLELEA